MRRACTKDRTTWAPLRHALQAPRFVSCRCLFDQIASFRRESTGFSTLQGGRSYASALCERTTVRHRSKRLGEKYLSARFLPTPCDNASSRKISWDSREPVTIIQLAAPAANRSVEATTAPPDPNLPASSRLSFSQASQCILPIYNNFLGIFSLRTTPHVTGARFWLSFSASSCPPGRSHGLAQR